MSISRNLVLFLAWPSWISVIISCCSFLKVWSIFRCWKRSICKGTNLGRIIRPRYFGQAWPHSLEFRKYQWPEIKLEEFILKSSLLGISQLWLNWIFPTILWRINTIWSAQGTSFRLKNCILQETRLPLIINIRA